MSYRLVIFDLGGVLVKVDTSRILRFICERSSSSPEEVKKILNDPGLLNPIQIGQLSPKQFYEKLKKRLGFSFNFEQFALNWNGILSENTDTTWVLERLRQRYNIGVLSNTNVMHDEYIKNTWPVFNHVHYWVASYTVGLMKPEPQIYQLMLKQADVQPHEAVYVDDVEEFVVAARRLGITSVHFTDGLELERELRNAGLHV
jgi:glucose-1-phosphatase